MAAYDILIKFKPIKPKLTQIIQVFEQSVGDEIQVEAISIGINQDTGLLHDFEGKLGIQI